jgi:hypothetical protein
LRRFYTKKVVAESILVYGEKKHIYLGIHAKGGPWVYTSSGTNLDFENWAPGQPNNNAYECAHIMATR